MFGIINRFSPKKPLARTRLRGPDGTIADQYMAHAMTVAFVQSMWQGPAKLPTYHATAPGIPFDLEELVAAVAKLHTNKSVCTAVFARGSLEKCPIGCGQVHLSTPPILVVAIPPNYPSKLEGFMAVFPPQTGEGQHASRPIKTHFTHGTIGENCDGAPYHQNQRLYFP